MADLMALLNQTIASLLSSLDVEEVGSEELAEAGPQRTTSNRGTSTSATARATTSTLSWFIARQRAANACGGGTISNSMSDCERDHMAFAPMPAPGVGWNEISDVLTGSGTRDLLADAIGSPGSDGITEEDWAQFVEGPLGAVWDKVMDNIETVPLGDRVLVVAYNRAGYPVNSYFRRRPRREGDGVTASANSTSIVFEEDTAVMRYGEHATEPPPHTLTDVRLGLVRLDERTPDGRLIMSEGFEVREPPLSFSAMFTTQHGMPGEAVIVGSLDEVTIEPDGTVWGMGWLLDEPNGRKAGRYIQAGALRGNSVELAGAKTQMRLLDDDSMEIDFLSSQLAATTLVGNPAMTECYVELIDGNFDFGIGDAEAVAASAYSFADRAPAVFTTTIEAPPDDAPPRSWFETPNLSEPTPITERDGRVFGHVALWDNPHLGNGMRPPRSQTEYAYFATGEVLTDDGRVPTGRLVIGGEHAALSLGWQRALDHYATTSLAWADVAVGEDRHGIWVAGRVRPGTKDDLLEAARASGVSGDWRRIGGYLELVAVLSVNVPAFPVPRSFADDGLQMTLTGIGHIMAPPARDVAVLNDLLDVVRDLQPTARSLEAERLTRSVRTERDREVAEIIDSL